MSEYLQRELLLFINAFWYGALLAIVYDCLRIFRLAVPHSSKIVAVEDFMFWLGTCVFLFARFFMDNSGILRGYLFLGVFLGAGAWKISLGNWFQKFLGKLVLILKKWLIPVKRLKIWKIRCNIKIHKILPDIPKSRKKKKVTERKVVDRGTEHE